MITEEERRALSYFGAKILDFGCSKDAVIVDVGTFIGASTTALAYGLHQSNLNQAKKLGEIWSYDLLKAAAHMVQPGQYLSQKGVKAGGSFRFFVRQRNGKRKSIFDCIGDLQVESGKPEPLHGGA